MSEFTQITLEGELAPVPIEQITFDYRLLSADKREFVLQKTDETQWLLKRTAENIIQIGKNLDDVNNVMPHGMYLPWLRSEFGMSRQTADNFRHVAKRFEGKLLNFSNLATSALYLLAAPDTPQEAVDEAIQRSQDEKITHALAKKIIDAQEAIKTAQEAEAQARAEAEIKQQKLFAAQQQIDALKLENENLTKPDTIEVEKEVIKEVIPDDYEDLQKQVGQLTSERDSEKERADKFSQRFMDELPQRQQKEADERIRAQWHALATEFQATVKHLIAEWPTVLQARAFEPDEWAEVEIIREAAARIVDECDRFRHKSENIFVDANGSSSSYALSLRE